MKKTMKKLFAVLLVVAVAAAMFTVTGFAAGSERSLGYEIGQVLGSIVFSPFLLVDYLVWIITGIHIFYW